MVIIPRDYKKYLTVLDTEHYIKEIKDFFEKALASELDLLRVSAPLFVLEKTGLNDNLNGVEEAVSFKVFDDKEAQIVHSLAKWKRNALYTYKFPMHTGLYTDMNAIRKDEELDNIHSYYVDQWDWEYIIDKNERTVDFLKSIVRKIYKVFLKTEDYVSEMISEIKKVLPDEIYFITTQELEDMYPDFSPKEREDAICKEKGAVFLMQVGDLLNSGRAHDGRSPDYDDWKLNGDLLLWYDVLDMAVELSSMGIRVDKDALLRQLEIRNATDRLKYNYHKMIINEELPYTIGGGLGQSRICMFFLKKAHICEVQSSVWSDEDIKILKENNIDIL